MDPSILQKRSAMVHTEVWLAAFVCARACMYECIQNPQTLDPQTGPLELSYRPKIYKTGEHPCQYGEKRSSVWLRRSSVFWIFKLKYTASTATTFADNGVRRSSMGARPHGPYALEDIEEHASRQDLLERNTVVR